MSTALTSFEQNIEPATQHVGMYKELRALKGLGARGRLDSDNAYLLWAIRASVVASMSALDTFVRDKLNEQIPVLLANQTAPIPEQLASLVSEAVLMKRPCDVRESLQYIRSASGIADLAEVIGEDLLADQTFQAPWKVESAFAVIGVEDVFGRVAAQWQGPNTTADELKRRLYNYFRRRNQIAHESDIQTDGTRRPITPNYARDCVSFITALATRLDATV